MKNNIQPSVDWLKKTASQTLEQLLVGVFGESLAIYGYTPFIDKIEQSDDGKSISARFSADLMIQLDGVPIYEAYIMRATFNHVQVGVEQGHASITPYRDRDESIKGISSSPRVNKQFAKIENTIITLGADDYTSSLSSRFITDINHKKRGYV